MNYKIEYNNENDCSSIDEKIKKRQSEATEELKKEN